MPTDLIWQGISTGNYIIRCDRLASYYIYNVYKPLDWAGEALRFNLKPVHTCGQGALYTSVTFHQRVQIGSSTSCIGKPMTE